MPKSGMIRDPLSADEIIDALKKLLKNHKGWENLLSNSLSEAKENAETHLNEVYKIRYDPGAISNLEEYYSYLKKFIKWTPHELNEGYDSQKRTRPEFENHIYFTLVKFYWLIDQPSGRTLQNELDPTRTDHGNDFTDWMYDVANSWGKFLSSTESITKQTLRSFVKDPEYKMFQYEIKNTYPRNTKKKKEEDEEELEFIPNAPSGWLTFNQFFARQMNPGLRPVAGMFDDSIINSPADSTVKAKYKISSDSIVEIKHIHRYHIETLLNGSPFQGRFNSGLFYHAFLGPHDYHRFHTPVRGTVVESRIIHQKVFLDVCIKDGKLHAPDSAKNGYEFYQTRGILVLESPIGLVAVIPVGMCQVSSVNITADVGTYLNKGDEFGYFQFGGSDIILLFEASSNVTINAAPKIHYNTGMCIGQAIPKNM